MSAPFQPGEIVDVVIKGVRVRHEDADGVVTVLAENPLGAVTWYEMPPQAAITRVAPAEWPPLPGDKWRDGEGRPWFAIDVTDPVCHEEQFVALVNTFGARLTNPYADVVKYGPFTLVHREEQDAPAEPEAALAAELDDVALLRAAAALLRDRNRAAFVEMTTCPGGYATPNYADYLLAVLGETEPRTPVLEFAVMMSPQVASALAAWLESVADEAEKHDAAHHSNCATEITDGHPIEIARAVLGEQDGGEK